MRSGTAENKNNAMRRAFQVGEAIRIKNSSFVVRSIDNMTGIMVLKLKPTAHSAWLPPNYDHGPNIRVIKTGELEDNMIAVSPKRFEMMQKSGGMQLIDDEGEEQLSDVDPKGEKE
jgi:hypothetical protein